MNKDITIFVDPSCPHCRHLKQYLHQKHIPFMQVDATTNVEAQRYLQRIDVPGVPVIRVGEDYEFGFNEARLSAILSAMHGAAADFQ